MTLDWFNGDRTLNAITAPDDRMVSLAPPSLSARAKHESKNRGISAESAIALAL